MIRTEDDILSMAPFKVKLGAETYQIKPLTATPQREWRAKLSETLDPIVRNFNPTANNATVQLGLVGALIGFPEALADLVFAYSAELPKDRILVEATEEQIAKAFSDIMVVAFPFLTQLATVTQLVRSQQA